MAIAIRLARRIIQIRYVAEARGLTVGGASSRWAARLTGAAAVGAICLAGFALVARGATTRGVMSPPSSLQTGFFDPITFVSPDAPAWFSRARASGATAVRLVELWSSIAPTRPANPTDPNDPAYRWTGLDAQVKAATAAGLVPVVNVMAAPRWAQPSVVPKNAAAGAWEPNDLAFRQFAQALASRYSGTSSDPASPGGVLPHVRYFQAWNEPNLSIYLAPQWKRTSGKWVAVGPGLYRSLLNAFYAGIKHAQPSATVVTGGTAPFGDPPGGPRIPPAEFDRDLFCLSTSLAPLPCPNPVHFDVLDHHPYAIKGPYTGALDPEDVSIPDMAKLERPLLAAERTGRVLPAGAKPVWATEVSYDSDPPDPKGVPMATLDRWTAETLYELWSEGVSLVSWFLIRDQAPVPSYADTYQSGMYLFDGTPKQEQRAFRFPLVVDRRGGGRPIVWTRVPVAGMLTIQGRIPGGHWSTIARIHVGRYQVVERHVSARSDESFRARVGAISSLIFGP